MNTQENDIPLLADLLDDFDKGTLDMSMMARKCYLTEKARALKQTTWMHNDELKGQSLLRKMSGTSARRDLLQNKSLI